MSSGLGRLEGALFAYAQTHGLREVRSGQLLAPLGLTPQQEHGLLSRMARRGLIAQVRRGFYLVPARLPVGGRWIPDLATALQAFMADRRAKYQICGPNAFRRYGFDTRVPSSVFVYNDRVSGRRTIGLIRFTFIKVAPARLGDVETDDGSDVDFDPERAVPISSRTRTLVDALHDWSRFGSLPRALDWIRSDLHAGLVTATDLVTAVMLYGNQGTARRAGVLLEESNADERELKRLERTLKSARSQIPLLPDQPKRGPLNRRWGVTRNDL
jgi:predicted transcriptional regulator of viral defense system